jgi:signal transduction histidine kinase
MRVDDALAVCIDDDGQGFVDVGSAGVGLGVKGMRERVEALGGEFKVEGRPGAGTTVRATLPLR